MVEITYQMVLSTLQTAGILVGILYYILTLRNQQKSRQAHMLHSMWEPRRNEELMRCFRDIQHADWSDWEDYRQKYNWYTNPEFFAKFTSFGNLFDGIGFMAQRGFYNLNDLYDYGGDGVVVLWRKFESIIPEIRRVGNPKQWEWWEYLVEEMERISDSRGDTFYGFKPKPINQHNR
jgi:hypothetical protein